ncbi:nitrate- and nitrite sensing domain-containing protein [Actinoplanes sp. NPDC049265]|uniref:sensor histidine kinase n=1 Tax=Actinoplanes sp. NPDC049265 TaxID=3363902 RepID=UPI00371A8355
MVALTALWTWEVKGSVADATALMATYDNRGNVIVPGDRLVAALQTERSQSVEMLAVPGGDIVALRDRRRATDAAFDEFRRLSRDYRGSGVSADITRARIADMVKTWDSLVLLRAGVDTRDITRAVALSGFNGIIGYAFSVSTAAAVSSDPLVERVMRTSVGLRRAGELLYQEDALLTGAITAGRFGPGEYRQLIEIVGGLRFQFPAAASTLPAPDQAMFKSMLTGPAFNALHSAEDRIIGEGGPGEPVRITREVWRATFTPAVQGLYAFLADGYDKAVEFATAARDRLVLRFTVSGLLGLLAILASLLLSARVGGSVVRRLSVLRAAANDLAHRQLPEMVRRSRAGEKFDGGTPPLALGDDEIADVGAALGEVRQSAISSAAVEAELRTGMNKVLLNIARRNQTLVGRQLEALAQPDTAEGEPAVVKAQQLAARMRRNAEHLVILAGSARTRRSNGPEPLDRIIARAVGEVEHAGRIVTGTVADAEIPERAVTDIGHLVAELLENATTFSAPDTSVRVSAQRVTHGVVIEIEDQGLGMTPSALDEANRRLAEPQGFDPAESARLGLFVVALLAAQRGIRVVLASSEGQGVTATVTVPTELAPPPQSTARPVAGRRRTDAAKLVGTVARSRAGAVPRHAAKE